MIIKTVHLATGVEHPTRGAIGWAKSYSAPDFTFEEQGESILITREGVTIGVHKSQCAFWVYEEKPAAKGAKRA